MPRQIFTAADIALLARQSAGSTLVLGEADVVTAEALDAARRLGVRLTRPSTGPLTPPARGATAGSLPPLKVVRGASVMMEPFGQDLAAADANVRLKDVVTAGDRSPMAAGFMALDRGEFAWTLAYDEVDVVLEGELVITRGAERVSGGPGDVIYIPKNSSITFGTPSRARFVYVTFPADWQ